MKKSDYIMEDELRPEYDLKQLEVRRLGPRRKSFGETTVKLEPDVARMFPDADAVNEALRLLIRIMQDHQQSFAGVSNLKQPERTDEDS